MLLLLDEVRFQVVSESYRMLALLLRRESDHQKLKTYVPSRHRNTCTGDIEKYRGPAQQKEI